jgi:uroporphyrinogen decarboxylase
MRSIDRIISAHRGEKTDRITVDAWWSEEIYEKIKSEKKQNPVVFYGLDTRRLFTEAPLLDNSWDDLLGKRRKIKIYSYPFPDVEMADTGKFGIQSKIKQIKDEGYPAIGHIGSICFEVIHNITGMENFFMAIYDKYDDVDDACEAISDIKMDMALELTGNGVDIVHMGDDFGSQKGLLVSPDSWRKLFKPRIAKVINAIKAKNKDCLVFFHSDGDITDIIGDFIEIGVDFLNPIQPECMDINWINDKYGHKISFWGGIGTQGTLYSDKDHIYSKVRETIEILGSNNRLVISPTHMIPGDVSIENIDHFFKAIKYFGSGRK